MKTARAQISSGKQNDKKTKVSQCPRTTAAATKDGEIQAATKSVDVSLDGGNE